jgi:hypothetical protein
MLVNGIMYLFQFPVTSTHKINHGIAKVGEKDGFPAMAECYFGFIILLNRSLKVPQLQNTHVQDLALYSPIVHPKPLLV